MSGSLEAALDDLGEKAARGFAIEIAAVEEPRDGLGGMVGSGTAARRICPAERKESGSLDT